MNPRMIGPALSLGLLLAPGALTAQSLDPGPAASGTNKESFVISGSGNAVLTLPVQVPPGIRGHEPDLSVKYSSTAGNGLLGVGFALTGFSKVGRVAQTIAVDGIDGAVNFTDTDQFALEGQRLLVMTGAIGTDGSTYRAEIDSFQNVTATGSAGTGPAAFTVQSPGGGVMTFGGTADAQVLVTGSQTVREWLLSSEVDLNGNTISYSYSTDPLNTGSASSQAYPVEIAYGTNPAANPGGVANRFVRFEYETRPDPMTHYVAGAEVTTALRLSAVSTWLGDDMVAHYRLGYEQSGATGRSRLVSFQRFDGADAAATGLSPTTFAWSDGANAFGASADWLQGDFTAANGWDATDNPVTLADVNGDGLMDIVGFKNGVQVSLGESGGYQAPTTWIQDFSPEFNWTADEPRYLADINGDGLADIVGFSDNGVVFALADAANAQFVENPDVFPFFAPNAGWAAGAPRYLADVNGDQMTDIVGFSNGVEVALATDAGSFDDPVSWSADFGLQQGWLAENLLLADVNGDGKSDVVAMNQQTQSVNVALSTGTAFDGTGWDQNYANFAATSQWGPDTPRMLADVNGDGLDDLVGFADEVQVGLSTGTGFAPPATWSTDFGSPNWDQTTPRMMMDVNGDGLADVVGVNDGGVQIAQSTGAGFVPGGWDQASLNGLGLAQGGTADETSRQIVDVNADGMMDMLAITPNAVSVGLVAGPYPDQMVNVTRASQGQLAITYKPISDPTVYAESAGQGALATFQAYRPLVQNAGLPVYRSRSRLTGRFYVVAGTVETNNPAITDDPYAYGMAHFYSDGESSTLGRGWLGFASTTHTNLAMGRQTTLGFRQDFPFIGRIATRTVSCAGNVAGACAAGDVFHADTMDWQAAPTETSATTGQTAQMVQLGAMRSDRYQGADYRHSIGKTFLYDAYGNRTQTASLNLVDQAGNDLDPADNVYINAAYQNDTATWRLGQTLLRKRTTNPALTGLDQFDAAADFDLRAWSYDAAGNIATIGNWDQANSQYLTQGYSYDGYGNGLAVTNPGGFVTSYEMDAGLNTYIASRTTPAGAAGVPLVTRYGYDARFGQQTLRLDPNGNQFTTCYDSLGRRLAEQGPAPAGTPAAVLTPACLGPQITLPPGVAPAQLATLRSFAHGWVDGAPAVSQTVLGGWPDGGAPVTLTTADLYDGMGRHFRMLAQSTPGGALDRVLEDKSFNASNMPLGDVLPYVEGVDSALAITRSYDAIDRLTATATPWQDGATLTTANEATAYEVTTTGETVTQVQAQGTPYSATQVVVADYFANQRQITASSYTDGRVAGQPTLTTAYGRDLLGRTLSVTPPGGAADITASYAYDSVGRVVLRDLPSVGALRFSYDADGRLASRAQGNGTVGFSYDALGRMVSVTYPGGLSMAYAYDGNQPNGLGRMASATVTGQAVPVMRSYAYDAYGQAITSALDLGTGTALTQTTAFDPIGRITQKTLPDGTVLAQTYALEHLASQSVNGAPVVSYGAYTALGLPQSVTLGNGASAALVFAPDFNTSSVTWTLGQTTLYGEDLTLDPYGYPLGSTGNAVAWSSFSKAADYASARLADWSDSRLGLPDGSFAYDDAGNLLTGAGLALVADGYRIGAGSTVDGADLAASYDAMGNLTGAAAPALAFAASYDGANRLATLTRPGSSATARYAYDHQGVRVWRSDLDGNTHVTLSRAYAETGGTPQLTLAGILGPVFQSSGGTQAYLHGDARRSVTFTTASDGSVQDWLLYSAYGQPVNPPATAPTLGFLGREYDADTGLYYYNQRYYHPGLGRFTTPDTQYGASVYRHDAPNRYSFLLNNPAWGYDPSGHGLPGCILGVGAGVFGTGAGVAQTIDGANQNNLLSSIGVGGGTIAASLFAGGAGIAECVSYYRARAAANNNAGGNNADDGNGGNANNDGNDGGNNNNGGLNDDNAQNLPQNPQNDGNQDQQPQDNDGEQNVNDGQQNEEGGDDGGDDSSTEEDASHRVDSDDDAPELDGSEDPALSSSEVDLTGSEDSSTARVLPETTSQPGESELGSQGSVETADMSLGSESGSTAATGTETLVGSSVEGESTGLTASVGTETASVGDTALGITASETATATVGETAATVTTGEVVGEVIADILLTILVF
ncbi:hypothetical protein GEU84_013965 [Fertoebacter nigrum]|uniref:Insecticide toxin TcdB middle/N-terminal domain-containing protein n=1 Tax=Fertoeibacter niger TaxID=2656921 RepID=A0A8X8KNY4_9RHOB|nr:RHS repeat-associated core domain-containing protein [Fertoeibacter niger]NUB45500.1 hypothetical protein [Fertoeibacter niger]